MKNIILINHPHIVTKEMISNRTSFAHLVLDPSWFRDDIGSSGKGIPNILSKETADQLEGIGRTFCFQIYRRRFQTLSEVESDTDSESDSEDTYSLHDSSSDIDSSDEESDWSNI